MANYVDGFVIPVPKSKLAEYRKQARKGAKVWMEHGALEYRECVGDDLQAEMGAGFVKGMKLKEDETVILAWVVYKSKGDRNRIMKKVMEDPRLAEDAENMPFNPKRMMFGGFKMMVSA